MIPASKIDLAVDESVDAGITESLRQAEGAHSLKMHATRNGEVYNTKLGIIK